MCAEAERARQILARSRILAQLSDYQAMAVSTLFVGFDTEGSDIDVICTCQSATDFARDLSHRLGHHTGFVVTQRDTHTVARFQFEGIDFEVYGSPRPPSEQLALRHYRVMERLVALGGQTLQQAVRAQRQRGLKTEPAIAAVLGLQGDPYEAVLALEKWDDERLKERVGARL